MGPGLMSSFWPARDTPLCGRKDRSECASTGSRSEQRRDRARSIITMVTGLDFDAAGVLLRRARWNVKAAIVMEKTGDTYAKALTRLKRAGDSVRTAIGEDIEPRLRERLTRVRHSLP